MPINYHVVASSEADLRFMAQAVGSTQLSSLYTGHATVAQMRAATDGLLAHPMVRKPVAGVPVIPATIGGVAGEWLGHVPAPGEPVALFLGGGGYVRGSLALGRIDASELAELSGVAVLNLAYRQGPEHRFPAAFDDAVAAFEALLARGFDAGKIVLVGESAGGGLAIAVVMKMRDQGRPLPAAVVAISAMVDMTMTGASWQDNAGRDIITRAMGEQLLDLYMGNADRRDPRASPVFGRFEGLPPLLLHVGGVELLLSDVQALASRAADAGVDVTVWTYSGMPHGITKFEIEAAGVAVGHVAEVLSSLLA